MRISLVVLVLAFAGLLAVDLEPSSTPHAAIAAPARHTAHRPSTPQTVEVAFVKNGWVVRVDRTVPRRTSAAEVALRELTQGPTKAERRRGIRTALPEGVRLRSLRPDGDSWLASFSRSTFAHGSAETKRTRLWQIAATLAPLGDEEWVAVAARGSLPDERPARGSRRRLERRERRAGLPLLAPRDPAAARGARLPERLRRHRLGRLPHASRRCSRFRAGRTSTARGP